ncbi:hypothetical protein PR202_gb06117 [Eleusine coracana subsp. coracana]|uniref:Polygalacturonase n=1 Tax=Eleusine coracana subsp. coracana TaxID=191504 RepID=A0AAV5E8J3_ELECO|nr:hypothetical protein PR202_gb06117 [Eleusine coracana subsp. coracana]
MQSCRVGTGDDCVSISNASFNIKMRRIECGPGHGISIGSLGKDRSVAAVANVVLEQATVRNAQNGVSNVVFRHITGTATRAEAIKLACSDAVPCKGIVLGDIDIRREGGDGGEVQAVCNAVTGLDEERHDEQGKDDAVRHTEL